MAHTLLGKAELHPEDGRELCWLARPELLYSHETEQRNELSGTQAWRPARAGGRSAGQWGSEWACVAGAKHIFPLKELLGARGWGW